MYSQQWGRCHGSSHTKGHPVVALYDVTGRTAKRGEVQDQLTCENFTTIRAWKPCWGASKCARGWRWILQPPHQRVARTLRGIASSCTECTNQMVGPSFCREQGWHAQVLHHTEGRRRDHSQEPSTSPDKTASENLLSLLITRELNPKTCRILRPAVPWNRTKPATMQ